MGLVFRGDDVIFANNVDFERLGWVLIGNDRTWKNRSYVDDFALDGEAPLCFLCQRAINERTGAEGVVWWYAKKDPRCLEDDRDWVRNWNKCFDVQEI